MFGFLFTLMCVIVACPLFLRIAPYILELYGAIAEVFAPGAERRYCIYADRIREAQKELNGGSSAL